MSCCGQSFGAIEYWFSDGYADYLRSFNWAMAAMPDLAPDGQSHLLGSTSVVQQVTYRHDRITYRTFGGDATEVLRLAFRPREVIAGRHELAQERSLSGPGYTLQALGDGGFVLHVRHLGAHDVTIAA